MQQHFVCQTRLKDLQEWHYRQIQMRRLSRWSCHQLHFWLVSQLRQDLHLSTRMTLRKPSRSKVRWSARPPKPNWKSIGTAYLERSCTSTKIGAKRDTRACTHLSACLSKMRQRSSSTAPQCFILSNLFSRQTRLDPITSQTALKRSVGWMPLRK